MSNIDVTPGSGKTVSTETVGSVEYQRVKIVGGETGSTSVMGVTPDGSIKVSVIGTIGVSGTVNLGTQSGSVVGFQGGTRTISGSVLTMFAPVASFVSAVTSVITSTSQTSVLATAPGAQRNYITQMLITNGALAGTFVDVMDGPNVIYSGYAAASGGGFSASFVPALKQTNTVQSVDIKVRTQASIIAAMSGYTAA